MSRRSVLPLLLILVILLAAQPAGAQSSVPFRVYLTFEDGPTDVYTPGILDILAQYNAKATFFVNGYQIAGREYLLQRMIAEGHAIGNHLWEEPGVYSGAADDAVRESYFRTEEAIRAAVGPELTRYEAQVKLYRQPGGGARPFPETEGVQVITYNWNVNSGDCQWGINADPGASYDDDVIDNVLNEPTARGRYNVYEYGDGAIVVLHDINRVTARVLPVILSELLRAGATFEALPRPWDAIGTMPVALGVPPAPSAGSPGVALPGSITVTARMRAEPFVGAEILIGSLSADTLLTVTGRGQGWYQVQYGDLNGWISADLVKVLGPIPSLPAVP
jgi:peptidoglycan/xylan/chitin deacetylase (PgdA/CDA1 family)